MLSEKVAPLFASMTAFILAIIKIITWIISWSVVILYSAVDSLMDMSISIINYFAVKFSSKPANEYYQYWHWKIEWIAIMIEWTIIFLSWLFVFYEGIKKIIYQEKIQYLCWSIVIMCVSIIFTFILVFYLFKVYMWKSCIKSSFSGIISAGCQANDFHFSSGKNSQY